MPTYKRETTLRAPLDDVWAFHSRIAGLEAVTPDWLALRVERVLGPDGETDPDALEPGSEVALSVRPFGVGPRQHWTSVITDRERDAGTAYFRDEMVHGPFDRWEHTHAFYADGDDTLLRDRVVYELPLGRLGDAAAPLSHLGFEAMFRERHRLAKSELESGGRSDG